MPKSISQVYALADQLAENNLVYFHNYDIHMGLDVNTHLKVVRYVTSDQNLDPVKPTIIFLHGTPGNWKIFAHQFASQKLKDAANLIAIERPGWGGSQYNNRQVEVSLDKQSEVIAMTVEHITEKTRQGNIILVGHSYGATLIPFVLRDLKQKNIRIHQAHLWAGNLSSKHQKVRWYNKMANTKLIQFFLDEDLKKSNVEMLALNDELKKMDSLWSSIDVPLVILQGKKDALVDPDNIKFAETIQTKNNVEVKALEKTGHIFLLTNLPMVEQELLNALND